MRHISTHSTTPVISIKVGTEFRLEVSDADMEAKDEAHALWTLRNYVEQRLGELVQLIADPVLNDGHTGPSR